MSAKPAQQEAEVSVAIKNDLWPESSNLEYNREKGAPLLDHVAVASHQAAQQPRASSGTREIPYHEIAWFWFPGTLKQQSLDAVRLPQVIRSLAKERLDTTVEDANPAAAKKNATRFPGIRLIDPARREFGDI